MIYVNDLSDFTNPANGTEAKVATITENGYYFWNGTEWIQTTSEQGTIWKYEGNKVFIDRNAIVDEVEYLKEGGYRHLPKERRSLTSYNVESGSQQTEPLSIENSNLNNSYNLNLSYSDLVKSDYTEGLYPDKALNRNEMIIDNNEPLTLNRLFTTINHLDIKAQAGQNFSALYATINNTDYNGSGKVHNLMGAFNIANHYNGTADYIRGSYNQASSFGGNDINTMEGTFSFLTPRGNANINYANGVRAHLLMGYGYGSNNFRIQRLRGIHSSLEFRDNYQGQIENMYFFSNGTIIKNNVSPNVKNIYGLYLENINIGTEANYAIYTNGGQSSLGDVLEIRNDSWVSNQETVFQFANGKSRKNVATSQIIDKMNGGGDGGSNLIFKTQSPTLGTNPNLTGPTEKLVIGADGKVKVNDLAGTDTRMVVANGDGVLSTQALPSNLSAKWVEDPSNNTVNLTVNSEGNPRTSNVVSVYDNGDILASGFKGTNGVSVFPDYVFENYYTGTSTTKAGYSFKNLDQVENFVKENGHLPGYTSAKEIKAQGYIDIMDTQLINVEKIEELYLHTIEQEKKIQQQSKEIEELKSLVKELLNK
ncbi:hypothetical protein KRX57_07140 [Weeksellaceae bacterium TAE3-ERU29]|nr:hypothetical protein [Weeksellaceae bacterium TAE3-ERU29]